MFYARLVQFKLGNGQRATAEGITNEFDKISRTLAGFRGNVYFYDDAVSEYRALNYWDTKEDAVRANQLLFPKLLGKLNDLTDEPPTYKFFEVYDPNEGGSVLASHIKWV
ncbi:hypothetical protein ACSU64_23615 [Bacillaceae bacterium C204]|uniref:hypothetical protein n=1 Tax=Neobacillus sp. 204 TaxID=3383351 RepID=UPI00397CF6A5